MTKLRMSDLPPALRARVEAQERGEGAPAKAPRGQAVRADVDRGVPSPLYRCVACGWEFMWSTAKDANPAAWTKHTTATGHGHARMVLA